MEIGLSVIAYRSAVQSSTGFTSYYLLYGKGMRLPLDIIYRPPLTEKSRAEYANDVRCTLEQAYDTVREKLYLAHERQKDYYNRRSHSSRYQSGDSVWLFNSVIQKGVAPKFYEPSTGQFKVTKRL